MTTTTPCHENCPHEVVGIDLSPGGMHTGKWLFKVKPIGEEGVAWWMNPDKLHKASQDQPRSLTVTKLPNGLKLLKGHGLLFNHWIQLPSRGEPTAVPRPIPLGEDIYKSIKALVDQRDGLIKDAAEYRSLLKATMDAESFLRKARESLCDNAPSRAGDHVL